MQVDLGSLTLAEGGYLLVKRAVRRVAPGEAIVVTGEADDLEVDLRAWCRGEGHRFDWQPVAGTARGQARILTGAALELAGVASPRTHPDQVVLYEASKV